MTVLPDKYTHNSLCRLVLLFLFLATFGISAQIVILHTRNTLLAIAQLQLITCANTEFRHLLHLLKVCSSQVPV